MTSNQIAAATLKENERHNREAEILALRAQQETESFNRRQTALKAAQIINEGAGNINNSIHGSYGNAIKAQEAANQTVQTETDKRYKSEMASISRLQQQENERHQKQQDALTLRNIQHYEYQDWLTAKQNDFLRNQKLFENNQQLLENSFRQVDQQMKRYELELRRAGVNVDQFKAQIDAEATKYEIGLKQAQTKAAKAKVYSDYINSVGAILRGLGSVINVIPF